MIHRSVIVALRSGLFHTKNQKCGAHTVFAGSEGNMRG